MNAERIAFTTRAMAGRGAGDSTAWTAQVLAGRTVSEAEFCAAVGERMGRSTAEIQYIFTTAGDVLREFLRQGCRVNLSDVGFCLTLTGKFPSEDAAPDESRNAVNICARATRALKETFRLPELGFVNVTRPLTARIFSVMDSTLCQDGVIADGSRVLITGEGLRIDTSAADEWVRLVDASGAVVAAGTILDNDAATLDCSFAELPPAGSYRVEVSARNGAEPSRAPAVVRKSVEVK